MWSKRSKVVAVLVAAAAVAAAIVITQLGTTQPGDDRTARERNTASALQFFELLGAKRVSDAGALWHENARITVPYPPEGFPTVIDGKDEIIGGWETMFANFETFNAQITGVYPSADSRSVTVEYSNRAQIVNGPVYTNDNIAVFVFDDDGLITEYHDYFDPRRFQVVVDNLPQG